jgi:hypothetical protein
MSGLKHGKDAVFKLDSLTGALTAISGYLRSIGGLPGKPSWMDTTTFGEAAKRREVKGLTDNGPISLGGPFNPAGSKIHGKSSRVLIDEYAPYAYMRGGSIERSIDLPMSEAWGDDSREHGVVGHKDGSLRLNGLFDSVANGSDAVLRDLQEQETPAVVTLGIHGFAIGSQVEMLKACQSEFTEPANHDQGPIPVNASFEPDDVIDLGVSLHDVEAATATGGLTSVDESATTEHGGVGHLHCTAFTGADAVIKIQHSPDNSTWADLITFATLNAVGAERQETATVTTAVHRYVRGKIASGTITSVTFGLAFARRGFTYGTAGQHRHFCGLFGAAGSASFEYGPEGGDTGNRKIGGEARLSRYSVNFGHDQLVDFSAELVVDGDITFGTF